MINTAPIDTPMQLRSTTVHDAIRKNNLAVKQLLDDEYQEAETSLLEAMVLLRPSLPDTSPIAAYGSPPREEEDKVRWEFKANPNYDCHGLNGGGENATRNTENETRNAAPVLFVDDALVAPHESQEVRSTSVNETRVPTCHESQFVFCDPIQVSVTSNPSCLGIVTRGCRSSVLGQDERAVSIRQGSQLTVALIFNLALTFHLSALHLPERRCPRQLLRKSQTLYEMALDLHLSARTDNSEDDEGASFLLRFAVLNNLGSVQHTLGDWDKSRCCFDELRLSIMYLIENKSGKEETRAAVVQHHSWDGFWENAMGCHLPPVAGQRVAPAA